MNKSGFCVPDLNGDLIPIADVPIADLPAIMRRLLWKAIGEIRASGHKTPAAIAAELNRLGYTGPGGTGDSWDAAKVRAELTAARERDSA